MLVQASLAQWFFLRLPSCGPGLKSLAHTIYAFQYIAQYLQSI